MVVACHRKVVSRVRASTVGRLRARNYETKAKDDRIAVHLRKKNNLKNTTYRTMYTKLGSG